MKTKTTKTATNTDAEMPAWLPYETPITTPDKIALTHDQLAGFAQLAQVYRHLAVVIRDDIDDKPEGMRDYMEMLQAQFATAFITMFPSAESMWDLTSQTHAGLWEEKQKAKQA